MSSGSSHIVNKYLFNPALKQITFVDYAFIELEGIKLITNITDGIIIYQFNDLLKNGTVLANVLTLTYDTTSMGIDDALMIIYEAPTAKSSDSVIIDKLSSIDTTLKNDNVITDQERQLQEANYSNIEKTALAVFEARSKAPTSKGLIAAPDRLDKKLIVTCALANQVAKSEWIDCANFASASFQIQSIIGSGTATYNPEISNDGITWVVAGYTLPASISSVFASGLTPSAGLLISIPVVARYLRISFLSNTLGHGLIGQMCLSSVAPAPTTINVGTAIVTSNKTNNAAVPAATNLGVLPAVANAIAPAYTETFQTALSVDLGGALRVARATDTPVLPIKDRGQPLSQNMLGEVRVDNTILRQTAERQLLSSIENNMSRLTESEQASSGDYGFEIR